ncbi:uncharacterized protein LOC121902592 isoform X2 [Thunnus maccoyii]|uniref:uncharacterized protein LOC121902592 isoform X2 n=1 Tax=Thunnus maccoyii TaxID=8240 RepID=UPI001C4B759B|nr:uncharacterized protein LOC121902592 isoform X2 [Thunnus maccoyii]
MENAGVEAEIYSQLKGKWLSFQSNHRDSVGHAAAFVHLSTCRRLPLLLKLRGSFKDAARPLQLCNTAAAPLRRDSKPRKQATGKGAPAESGSMQSFSVNLSTPVRSQPDHPSLAARPSLLWLSLTCCHSRAIIMTLLHTIHLHGRVPEALCSSSQITISLSLLPYFSTRPEFTRICYHITKIYASSSPPPVSRFHQGVILYYSRIHLPLSYPVTSRWGLIAKDFSTVIYHAYSINIIYFIKKLSLS